MSTGPAIPETQPFKKLTLKIQVQGHGQGQILYHISELEFNWYVFFLFRSNRITFGLDIANSIFDLEYPRSKWKFAQI